MAAEDTRRNTPSASPGIVKSRKPRAPPLTKVRAKLRLCLQNNDFKMVEALATLFKKGLLPLEYRAMKLLAECFEKMGNEAQANWCHLLARKAKDEAAVDVNDADNNNVPSSPPPKIGQTSPLTPPRREPDLHGETDVRHVDMDLDEKIEEEKEEEEMVEEKEEEEEPLDLPDYAAKLDEIMRQPSLTEEVLLAPNKSPSYERCEDPSRMEMTVKMRLPLAHSPWKREFGGYLTAMGVAPMTRKDTQGGNRAFHNARNRAAKQAIDKLADMCKNVEDESKVKLQLSLDNWFNTLRREDYVDNCYHAFKRARDIVFTCTHDGLYSARVFLYGSATTGLVLGDSDIDVAVALPLPKSSDNNPKYMHAEVLSFLKRAVERKMTDVELIASARVPVLRYYDTDAKIDVDITIANDTSVLLSRLLRKHLKDDIRIWELCMAVKYWARRRRISGAPEGHINPLGWIIMAIYFLQHHATPRIASLYKTKGSDPAHAVIQQVPWSIPKRYGKSSIQTGELLLQFFKFFGYNFDFANEAISINMQYPEQIHALTGRRHGSVIFIEQPLEHGVNVVDYVKATTMDIVMTELRNSYSVGKTLGITKELFKVREKNEEDRIFGR